MTYCAECSAELTPDNTQVLWINGEEPSVVCAQCWSDVVMTPHTGEAA